MPRIDEETLKKNCSRNLRYLRLKVRLSQEGLAQKIGITRKSISRYETGTCLPPCHVLAALGSYYGFSMDELMSESLPSMKGRLKTNENITYCNPANDCGCKAQADSGAGL